MSIYFRNGWRCKSLCDCLKKSAPAGLTSMICIFELNVKCPIGAALTIALYLALSARNRLNSANVFSANRDPGTRLFFSVLARDWRFISVSGKFGDEYASFWSCNNRECKRFYYAVAQRHIDTISSYSGDKPGRQCYFWIASAISLFIVHWIRNVRKILRLLLCFCTEPERLPQIQKDTAHL